ALGRRAFSSLKILRPPLRLQVQGASQIMRRGFMRSEKEKMLAGELYDPLDPELSQERLRCRTLLKTFNDTREDQTKERTELLNQLFGAETGVWIQPPFFCDYGTNIRLGSKVFFN